MHGERFCFAAGVDEQVTTALGDARDRGVVPHTVAESVRKRLQVQRRPVAASRVAIRRWARPAGGFEQRRSLRVDQLRPWGEQPDVRPLLHRSTSGRAGLQHDALQATRSKVSRGCKASRSGPDHDDR